MRRRGRGLSFGSVFILALTLATVLGSAAFFRIAGKDSPVNAMSMMEIAGTIGSALQSPAPKAMLSPEPSASAAPLADASPSPAAPEQPVSLSLSLGGMLRFDSDIAASESFISGGEDILAAVAPLFQGDLCIAGFDHIISPQPRRGDDVRVPELPLDLIKKAGVNALALPVGRILDDGAAGAQATLDMISARHLYAIGLGGGKILSLRVNGLSIAWLHISRNVSKEGQSALSDAQRGALLLPDDIESAGKDIAALNGSHDMIIVSLNWQTGSGKTPLPAQVTAAHHLAALGADLVLGYGGEQVQEIERYHLEDADGGSRDVLIAYSLGTLLSENRQRRELLSGMVLQIGLEVTPRGGGLAYTDLRYSPTYVRKWTQKGKTFFAVLNSAAAPPEDMSNAQREAMARSRQMIDDALKGSGVAVQR